MSNSNKSRRQFLKNVSLASLGIGLSPVVSSAKKTEADACEKTTLDYYGEGPFYTENPPVINGAKLAGETESGTKIRITGRVQNLDCSEFIPETIIDVWHADNDGKYDNEGYHLRGKTKTNAQGFFIFETIKPGEYLNGSKYRPSHIHFKITPPGHSTLTTQLYFAGDTSIAEDAAASISSGQYDATHRIIELVDDGNGVLEGTWDIAIDGKGTMGVGEMHLDKGIIYSASPNPFSGSLQINYGVFKKAEVSLLVFDMQGREVACVKKQKLSPEKYDATWTPDAELHNGHYFIALKINDVQVHYIKVQYARQEKTY